MGFTRHLTKNRVTLSNSHVSSRKIELSGRLLAPITCDAPAKQLAVAARRLQ
jgi:hypothetical protein